MDLETGLILTKPHYVVIQMEPIKRSGGQRTLYPMHCMRVFTRWKGRCLQMALGTWHLWDVYI